MQSFNKILIANRGEIACRIIRTCHEMGISTVAVFSDADRAAPFVQQADEAIYIGPAPSADSYLLADKIIEAARRTGAEAIHPGYGFLAENADFATACANAKIVFIGPSPAAITLLGSKQASKERVSNAGVPVVPSFDLEDRTAIEYPVLLKASAGGGGKGMQIVRSAADLDEAIASAKRVATSAFGDDTILVEQYVEAPRHIEIQILGDQHGNLVHLFERECSIQRRHQKIIEESPAVNLSAELRNKIASAAIAVGKAANYTNAGTVEFILAPNGEFYFLEVNTRLQVEHPVTECVTGMDLVREQIRVAQGEELGYTQDAIEQRGAALECRLYAEDCEKDFLPCSGRILTWQVPGIAGLRVDTGVESGSEISIHYDPMIAKLVTHANSRPEAIQKMRRTLRGLCCSGLTTNRAFLEIVLSHPGFAAGGYDTGFLESNGEALRAPGAQKDQLHAAAMAATFLNYRRRLENRQILPGLAPGYRNSRWREERVGYRVGEDTLWIGYRPSGDALEMRAPVPSIGLEATMQGEAQDVHVEYVSQRGNSITLNLNGHRRQFQVTLANQRAIVLVDGHEFDLYEIPRFPDHGAAEVEGGCTAPMPGTVVKVEVKNGDAVRAGDTILILEAMKMEHRIKADQDGLVSELKVVEGDQVDGDQLVAVVTPAL